jgi:hypothetical protein
MTRMRKIHRMSLRTMRRMNLRKMRQDGTTRLSGARELFLHGLSRGLHDTIRRLMGFLYFLLSEQSLSLADKTGAFASPRQTPLPNTLKVPVSDDPTRASLFAPASRKPMSSYKKNSERAFAKRQQTSRGRCWRSLRHPVYMSIQFYDFN